MEILVLVAWPYANAGLHLGHLAGAFLPADIFARFHRQKGDNVLMVSGSDMHGTPVEVAAEKAGVKPASIAHRFHKNHLENLKKLGMSFSLYTTTDTTVHRETVQGLFLDLCKKGYLVKKKSKQFWSEEEKKFLLDRFIEGECPHCHYEKARGDQCDQCGRTLEAFELIDPKGINNVKLVLKETENFFLDLPKLQKDITEWLENHPNTKNWKQHVLSFTGAWLKEGLKMRPMTRDLSYGLPLPDEIDIADKDKKVIYVWFEAVCGYLSAAREWSKRVSGAMKGEEDSIIFSKYKRQSKSWRDFWQNKTCRQYYFMGKDNIIFHTIIWPAILLGWNKQKPEKELLQLAYDVPANAFLNLERKKMSKSRNWFVSLEYLLETYGQDLVRFYFSLRMPENRDSDFRWKDFIDVNNNELVANLGNFIHRSLTFIESRFDGKVPPGKIQNEVRFEIRDAISESEQLLEAVKFSEALQRIFKLVSFGNRYFDKKAVWKVIDEDKEKACDTLYNCVQIIEALRVVLSPFLPDAMARLSKILGQESVKWTVGEDHWKFEKIEAGRRLKEVEILFEKIDPKLARKERAKLGEKVRNIKI